MTPGPITKLSLMAIALVFLCALSIAPSGNGAWADTRLDCDKETECDYRISLGQLATKKFNGHCSLENYKVTKIKCEAGQAPMTCTISATCGDNCSTCSCTNWATAKRIDAKVKVPCQFVR